MSAEASRFRGVVEKIGRGIGTFVERSRVGLPFLRDPSWQAVNARLQQAADKELPHSTQSALTYGSTRLPPGRKLR